MHGPTALLALVAFTFSTGVVAAPRVPMGLDMKRSPSNTLPIYDIPSAPHVRRAASTGAASAAEDAPAAEPAAAAANPFTQVFGDIAGLDPLAAVGDITAPITGALPIKAREETVDSVDKTTTA